jgi:hypothetical protein
MDFCFLPFAVPYFLGFLPLPPRFLQKTKQIRRFIYLHGKKSENIRFFEDCLGREKQKSREIVL